MFSAFPVSRLPIFPLSPFLRGFLFLTFPLFLLSTLRLRADTVLDIPVFAGGYGLSFYQDTARQFERLRAADHVRIKIYGDPRIADKISVRVIGGDLPDAASAGYVPWPILIRAGKVIDLTPYLDGPNWEGDARWRDTFLPGALDSWKVDGRTCGLPFNYACWTLFYNRALFRAHGWPDPATLAGTSPGTLDAPAPSSPGSGDRVEGAALSAPGSTTAATERRPPSAGSPTAGRPAPAWTWDRFFALCEQIKPAGIAPLALPGTRGLYPEAFLRAAFYDRAGPDGWRALTAYAPGAYSSPAYIEAAAILQRITQHDTLAGWEGATHTGAQLAFLNGQAAMTVSGSWMVNEMAGKIPPGFELGAANFPVFADGRADPTTIQTGSDCFFVFDRHDAARTRLTIDFLRYLTSRERATAFVRTMNSPVAVRGVPASAYAPEMRDTVAMITHARAAFAMPQTMMQPPTLLQATTDARFDLMTGALTPRQFGEKLEAAAEIDRQRAAHPNRVEYRHPVAGTLFLLGLLASAAWLLFSARRPSARRRRIPSDSAVGGVPPPREAHAVSSSVLSSDSSAEALAKAEASAKESPQSDSAPWERDRPRPPSDSSSFAPLRPTVAATFVGPSLLLYLALVILPALSAFAWAFTRWNGLGPRTWAGLFNFKTLLFENDTVWQALGNNLFLVVVPALVVVPTALLFAALIHRGAPGGKLFRVIFLFPNMLGGIAATLLWLNAYEPRGGLINATLVALGRLLHNPWLLSFDGYPWLTPEHLYGALVPIYLWMACGFNLILYLAAMEGIDAQLYEAAELDGASHARQFFTVTLPLIWDVIGISAVFLVIGGLNAFEMVWLLTSQDPPSQSHTLSTLLVVTMFKLFDIGHAAALAVILLALVLVASGVILRVLKRDPIE